MRSSIERRDGVSFKSLIRDSLKWSLGPAQIYVSSNSEVNSCNRVPVILYCIVNRATFVVIWQKQTRFLDSVRILWSRAGLPVVFCSCCYLLWVAIRLSTHLGESAGADHTLVGQR